MEIIYLEETSSTHLMLIEQLQKRLLSAPVALCANVQGAGVGSRGNSWQGLEGNLFLSFCLDIDTLPSDLPKSSMSIYFSALLREVLTEFGSSVFLKWPNDFYLGDKKVGGTITKILNYNTVICSMGINLKNAPKGFATIDIDIDKVLLIESLFLKLQSNILWKEIYGKYLVEFELSRRFLYYDEIQKKKVSLRDAKLLENGAIKLNGREVYSLR